MTRPKPKFCPTPRIWSCFQTAIRLGMSPDIFKKRLPTLQEKGFPEKDELLGGYDADAIESWLDKRSNLDTVDGLDLERELEEWEPSG